MLHGLLFLHILRSFQTTVEKSEVLFDYERALPGRKVVRVVELELVSGDLDSELELFFG